MTPKCKHSQLFVFRKQLKIIRELKRTSVGGVNGSKPKVAVLKLRLNANSKARISPVDTFTLSTVGDVGLGHSFALKYGSTVTAEKHCTQLGNLRMSRYPISLTRNHSIHVHAQLFTWEQRNL